MLFPIHLDLTGKRVLVVGGGPVAVRRARAAVACGADVRVVALEVSEALNVPVELRAFEPEDVDGAWLVLSCTGTVDDKVAELCEGRHIWCVRSDDHAQSDAWMPAVARIDEVVVSVTSGRNPRRSVAVRDAIVAKWHELDGPR